MCGLVSKPEHNELRGVVVLFDCANQRYGMQLDHGAGLSLRLVCVIQMPEVQFDEAGRNMENTLRREHVARLLVRHVGNSSVMSLDKWLRMCFATCWLNSVTQVGVCW